MTIKEILNQYIWLIDTLYQSGNKGITIKELNNKWQNNTALSNGGTYARRTFNNHRQEILDIFGITIDCNRRTNRYFISEPDSEQGEKKYKKWLLDCIALNNMVNENFTEKIMFEKEYASNQWLTTIAKAIREQTKIHIEYQRMDTAEIQLIKYAEPLALKQFKGRWHVLCHRADQKFHVYELNNISALRLTKANFLQSENFNVREFWENHYGVLLSDETMPQKILLKVAETQAPFLRNQPLHHSQKEGEQKNGFVFFEYFLAPTSDFQQALLAQGATVEVLKPSELRQAISEMAESIHKQNRWFQKKSVSLQRKQVR